MRATLMGSNYGTVNETGLAIMQNCLAAGHTSATTATTGSRQCEMKNYTTQTQTLVERQRERQRKRETEGEVTSYLE